MPRVPVVFVAALVGCSNSAVVDPCANLLVDGGVSGLTAEVFPSSLLVSGDISIRGSVTRPVGVTIGKILVAGVAATDDGSNFSAFNATVPFGVLQSLAASQKTPTTAMFTVSALTSCSSVPVTIGGGTLTLVLAPKITTSLTIAPPAYPTEANYFPTTKSVPLRIDLTANPEAAGAAVTISSTLGTIAGSSNGAIMLAGDGSSSAKATAFLIPDPAKEGVAEISASTTTTIATPVGVNLFGPPALLPQTAAISPVGVTRVNVLSKGTVAACSATPGAGLSITSGKNDLTASAVSISDNNGDKIPDIEISFSLPDAGTPKTVATSIVCLDVFGQVSSTGTYQVAF